MKHMVPNKEDKITVKVESYKHNKSLQLTLNWDADVDDWVDAFKTILIHQTFGEDTVKELFEPWHECCEGMEDKTEITDSFKKDQYQWLKDQNINKVSCGPVGKEVW